MKRILFALLTVLLGGVMKAQYKVYTTPVVPLTKPVSGHFSGELNGQLWTWGGYSMTADPQTGKPVRRFNDYGMGACVDVPQGTVCIGGSIDGTGSLREVFLSRRTTYRESNFSQWTYDRGSRQTFPALPKGLHSHAATYADGYIYVAGGQSDSIANSQVYRLKWPDGQAWDSIAVLPGKARIDAVVAVQQNAKGPALYVFGGYAPAALPSDTAFVHRTGLCLDLRTCKWTVLEWSDKDMLPAPGACALPLGCATVAVMGGVNADIFTRELNGMDTEASGYFNHPAEWYKYQQDVLIYNTYTNTWKSIPGNSTLALANAGLAKVKGFWFMNGGETKPGECSTQVTCVEIVGGNTFSLWDYALFVLFVLLGLGMLYFRRAGISASAQEGQREGHCSWMASGVGLYMSTFGGVSFWILPLAAFAHGWSILIPYVGSAILFLLFALYLFPRINTSETLGQQLQEAAGKKSRLLWTGTSVLSLIIRMLLWVLLPSWLLASILHLQVWACVLLVGLIPLIAAIAGGRRAARSMDRFQFLFLALLVLATVAIGAVRTDVWPPMQMTLDELRQMPFSVGVLCLIPFLVADPGVLSRVHKGCREDRKKSLLLTFFLTVLGGVLFMAMGICMQGFYRSAGEVVFPLYAQHIAKTLPHFLLSAFPAGLGGFFIAIAMGLSWSALLRQSFAVNDLFAGEQPVHSSQNRKGLLIPAGVLLLAVCLALLSLAVWPF